MHFILPAAEVAKILHGELLAYRGNYQNALVDAGYVRLITPAVPAAVQTTKGPLRSPEEIAISAACNKIVYAMFEDALNDRLIWVGPEGKSVKLDETMNELFPTWDTNAHRHLRLHFCDVVLDRLSQMVQSMVTKYITERSWNVWTIAKLGNDLMFESGQDFRIVDWTRRMESGEWTSQLNTAPTEFEEINAAVEQEIERSERRAVNDQLVRHGLPAERSNAKVVRIDQSTAAQRRTERAIQRERENLERQRQEPQRQQEEMQRREQARVRHELGKDGKRQDRERLLTPKLERRRQIARREDRDG